ncbi:MAG: TrmB family transcriptional regulator [Nitrososphaerales archaeon]
MNEREAVQQLTQMGMTEYQSKVYTALAALGPSGVSDITKLAKVPRTKIYETLDELVTKGVVEFQPGRPIVYRAIKPSLLIKRMTEDYLDSAKKAETMLEENYESITDSGQDFVWIVRGDETIRRKLAEVVVAAKGSIFAIESYPPHFIRSVKSLLKAASKRGLKVRAVCVAQKDAINSENLAESDPIEYRTLSASNRKRDSDKAENNEDAQLLRALNMAISGFYCLVVVDDFESFVIMQNSSDPSRSTGLSAKIPGVSILQRIMFEKLFAQRTRPYTKR